MSGDWRNDAACREVPGDIFFPHTSGDSRAAKAVCRTCPVLTQCLNLAMDDASLTGVWGGTTESERKAIRRDRGKRPRETGAARNVAMSMVARGISRAEIADRLGVTTRTITRWKESA